MAQIPYKPDLTTERGRHLHWCKQRAFEYLERGEIEQAWASFQSDMGKNEETANHPALQPMLAFFYMDYASDMKRFIEGFN